MGRQIVLRLPLLPSGLGGLNRRPRPGCCIPRRDPVVTYADGSTETCSGGSVFHWVAGHSVRVENDAELILFSPQQEHGEVLDHIAAKLAGV